jgi:hypothetical protein
MKLTDNTSRSRVFFAAHNKHHVDIIIEPINILTDAGVNVVCVAVDGSFSPADRQFCSAGLSHISVAELRAQVRAGDIVVVLNDWLPPGFCSVLEEIRRAGVITVGVIEGCRFALPHKYTRVDCLLGWGPSSKSLLPESKYVVGSPVLEKMMSSGLRSLREPLIVINYKSKPVTRRNGRDANWLPDVVAACGDLNFVISSHPASGEVDPQYKTSAKPIDELLHRASLVISPCSTVIYQALVLGAPTILFPIAGENLGELGEPMGAFLIARDRAELVNAVQHLNSNCRLDPDPFLAHHVDRSVISASKRIADAIVNLLQRFD